MKGQVRDVGHDVSEMKLDSNDDAGDFSVFGKPVLIRRP